MPIKNRLAELLPEITAAVHVAVPMEMLTVLTPEPASVTVAVTATEPETVALLAGEVMVMDGAVPSTRMPVTFAEVVLSPPSVAIACRS